MMMKNDNIYLTSSYLPGPVINVPLVEVFGEVLIQPYGLSIIFSTFLVPYEQAQWP